MICRAVHIALAACLALGFAACDGGGDEGDPPVFPEDFAATYQEVRNCRPTIDHDLMRISVLAAPDALAIYQNRSAPFPEGAVVLKPQFDASDTNCSKPPLFYTVMQKLAPGSSPATLDWTWQRVEKDFKVDTKYNIMRCIGCHTDCGKAPDGHDGTCTVP